MVQLKLSKFNIIDVTTVAVITLLLLIGVAYYIYKPAPIDTNLTITVHVGSPAIARAVLVQAKADKSIFLNSINLPISVKSVRENVDSIGQIDSLDITLEGPGYCDKNGNYVFNGQRIMINQKAEIRSNYLAKGAIIKIENAN